MDHQPALEPSPSNQTVGFVSSSKRTLTDHPGCSIGSLAHPDVFEFECDQAIFTSQKSPMGEGYRIVAASPGIRPEEKAEITRQSPSHGALSATSQQAVGMMAYPLPTGRYCVCHCKHDGAEHTARGGQRVRTHVAILDPPGFQLFHDNPFAVHQALANVHVAALRGFNPSIPRLTLKSEVRYSPPRYLTTGGGADTFLRVVRSLLSEDPCVLASVPEAKPTLHWALMMLPLSMRPARSFSVGVSFSLARRLTTTAIHHDLDRVKQMIAGQSIQWRDFRGEPLPQENAYNDWVEFVHRRVDQHRLHEVESLTNQMHDKITPVCLTRVAKLCQDRDVAESGDREVLETLQKEYDNFSFRSELESKLAGGLLELIEARLAEMNEADAALEAG
ncbi:MAG: hypothetical protein GXP29_08950, partial [Planctomycetes bacterium]|nr:hypothetical protein [Planctomycetota bacterium]